MMNDDGVAGFVRQHLKSVWRLELLLLLKGTPGHAWTVDALVMELRASTPLVTTNLKALERSGLVLEDEGAYRYAAASDVLDGLCETIAAAYRERPVALINLIAAPDDQLQKLADAFRFRREPQ